MRLSSSIRGKEEKDECEEWETNEHTNWRIGWLTDALVRIRDWRHEGKDGDLISKQELGLACTLTSNDVSEKTGYGIILGSKDISGLVGAVTNFAGTDSEVWVKVVEERFRCK